MSARVLKAEEWGRIPLSQNPLLEHVDPLNVDLLAVEDGDRIVGSLMVMRATHFEGLWIHPEKRGNPGVMRALLRLAHALAEVRGEKWVFAGADRDETRGFLERVGGNKLRMDLYALPLGRT